MDAKKAEIKDSEFKQESNLELTKYAAPLLKLELVYGELDLQRPMAIPIIVACHFSQAERQEYS